MKSIQNRKTRSKRESRAKKLRRKEARKIQRLKKEAKRKIHLGKKLTEEQKKKRSQQLAARKEFKEQRKRLQNEKIESENIQRIQSTLSSIFNSELLDQLAKKSGYIKRAGGQITAFAFMYIVSFGFFGNGKIALTYLVSGLSTHFKIFVTTQALSKRINSINSKKYLKMVFTKLLEVQLKIGLKNNFSETFSMFTGIYLQDSTQFALNEELSEKFEGNGGGASKSAVKLDFIYDIVNFVVHGVKVASATINDNTNAKEIIKYIKPGSLVIRDLGYLSINCLRKIVKTAYYISRLSVTTNVYLNKDDEEPLDVPKYLKKLAEENKDLSNISIYIGKEERFETRLVTEKVPESVGKQRTEKFKKCRKKIPSPYYMEWCGYSIFITNIPAIMLSVKMIIEIYKIRWQIELVFRNLKSNTEVNIIKGTNSNRVESLIYGRLITIVVMFIIQNYAMHISKKDKEVSFEKLTKLLISDNNLSQAIVKNNLFMLLLSLEYDLELIYKQKRKRKTTMDSVKEALENKKPDKEMIMPLKINVDMYFNEMLTQEAV